MLGGVFVRGILCAISGRRFGIGFVWSPEEEGKING